MWDDHLEHLKKVLQALKEDRLDSKFYKLQVGR